jgi:hypothetical protein
VIHKAPEIKLAEQEPRAISLAEKEPLGQSLAKEQSSKEKVQSWLNTNKNDRVPKIQKSKAIAGSSQIRIIDHEKNEVRVST